MKDIRDSIYKSYEKLREYIENVPSDPNEWTTMHSLAYICHMYKLKFGTDFILSYDAIPSKCHEYKMTSRIWNMLQAKAGHGQKVKDFIDWFYATYKGRKFRSIGALCKADVVGRYIEHSNKPPTMNTELPEKCISLLKNNDKTSYVATYGDLYFLMESYELKRKDLFDQIKNDLISVGFDINKLKQIQ